MVWILSRTLEVNELIKQVMHVVNVLDTCLWNNQYQKINRQNITSHKTLWYGSYSIFCMFSMRILLIIDSQEKVMKNSYYEKKCFCDIPLTSQTRHQCLLLQKITKIWPFHIKQNLYDTNSSLFPKNVDIWENIYIYI